MKKLLLFLMLIVATLSARAQVVYLTLDHDGQMVQKTNEHGKIYFAITGKVHNVGNLDLSEFRVQGNVQGDNTYFYSDVTTDNTFELKVPMNIPIGSTILIKFMSRSQSDTGNGIAPYVKMTCGFENKLVNKGVTWDDTNKKFTYTFQYQLLTDNAVTEDGKEYSYNGHFNPQPADPRAFENKLYITTINSNTAILGADSYEGSEYNTSSSMSDNETSGTETELTDKDVTYNTDNQTFTCSSTAIAGTLALRYYSVDRYGNGSYEDLVKDDFRAYTVNLNLKNDDSDKTKKQIHAEVKDVAGNMVTGGKLYYAIGYYNNGSEDDKKSTDASEVAFYENNLEHYNRVAVITSADELASLAAHASDTPTPDDFSTNFYDLLYCLMRADDTGTKTYESPIDYTGARSLKDIDKSYYQSTELTEEGTADITCDLEHWTNRKINYTFKAVNPTEGATEPLGLTIDETSSLRVYFWYSPDGNVKNNGSLFYAYKTMDDQMTVDSLDKWTIELAKGTTITYVHDENSGNTNYYFGTVQTKKNGTPAKAPYEWSGTTDNGTSYEYEFFYSVGSDKTSPKISEMTPLTSSLEPGEADATYTIKIGASDLGVSKLYIASAIKMNNVEYPIAINGYNVPGKVDRECSTTVNYTNYLGDDENGELPSEGRVYDDLTGLLKKEWTNGPKFEEAKEGLVWTSNDKCHYYHVNGNTKLSQTITSTDLDNAVGSFESSNTFTLQAIVRSKKDAKIQLHLTHGTDDDNKDVEAHATVLGLYENDQTHSTIDHNGCVDAIYTVLSDKELMDMGFDEYDIPRGGWQKIEATVGSGAESANLGISITSDEDFDLADVVLLLNANKNDQSDQSHFLTTVPAIAGDTTGEYFSDDGDKLNLTSYKKFSFFDRGPNINRIVEMARGTVMNYVNGAESVYAVQCGVAEDQQFRRQDDLPALPQGQ